MRDELPDLPPVTGRAIVELRDERSGRLVDRHEGKNFVVVDMRAAARFWQRLVWGLFSPGTPENDPYGASPLLLPRQPNDHLACWGDSLEADPANDHLLRGYVTAFASRWPVAAPTFKRGNVNVTDSIVGPDLVRWVFDWTNSTGNGTFQSVGWTRLVERPLIGTFPMPRFPEPTLEEIRFDPASTISNSTFSKRGGAAFGCICWDPVAEEFVTFSRTASETIEIRTYPAEGGASTGVLFNLNDWPQSSGPLSSVSDNWTYGITKIENDYVIAGRRPATFTAPDNRGLLRRYSATGTLLWTHSASASEPIAYYAVTVDGAGKLWTAGSDGRMRRHDPATGAIEVTVHSVDSPSELRGIAYDPASDGFWLSYGPSILGVVLVDSSGALIGPSFGFSPEQAVTTSGLYSAYRIPASGAFDPYAVTRNSSSLTLSGVQYQGSVPSGYVATGHPLSAKGTPGQYGGGVLVKDGTLYLIEGGVTGTSQIFVSSSMGMGATALWPIEGHSMATRIRLSSPVTKTSTQTMKITYEFAFE